MLSPPVTALGVFDDGGGPKLYVGGSFASAGGVLSPNLARLGPGGWSAVGGQTSLKNLAANNGTSIAVLAVGVALAIWSLTGAMQNVQWALNLAYDRDEGRGFVHRRVAALTMLVFALIGFGLAFGVLVLGPHLSTWIGNAVGAQTPVKIAWYIAEWPLLIGGLLFVFAGLRYFGPDVKHPRWRLLSFGAIVALAIWLIASGAFAFYTSRFSSYNKTWGSLAAVVVMLTWLWLTSVALLFGAEIDAEADRART